MKLGRDTRSKPAHVQVQVRDPPKNPMKREAMDYVASLGLKWANVPTTLKSMDTPVRGWRGGGECLHPCVAGGGKDIDP